MNVEKFWKNKAKPISFPSRTRKRTSQAFLSKIHSSRLFSSAFTSEVSFSYSAIFRMKKKIFETSFLSALLKDNSWSMFNSPVGLV